MFGGLRGVIREYGESFRIFRSVVRNRDLARVELAFAGFSMAESATWIAIGVYAHAHGGAKAVGVVALVLLLPASLVAPFGASLADRFRRERVLLFAYVLQAMATAATGAAIAAGAPPYVVIALAAVASVTQTPVRPSQGALLPSLARTAEELTAGNVGLATTRNISLLFGPLVAGLLITWTGPGSVYACMALILASGALLTAGLPATRPVRSSRSDRALRRALGGIRELREEPRTRALLALLFIKYVALGLLRVLLVVIAIELLGLGRSGAGWLNAALGLGGALGAGVTVLLIGRRRLSPAFLAGTLLWGVPLLIVGTWPQPVTALLMVGLTGVGRSLMDVSGRTFLCRVTPAHALARVLGLMESLQLTALAIGSAIAAGLIAGLGTRAAMLLTGALLPLVGVALWKSMSGSDRGPVVSRHTLELLLNVPMFRRLDAARIERLAAHLEPRDVAAGTAIIRQGDVGDSFYIVDEGEAEAVVGGDIVAAYGRGGYFGEIALLRDVPRTATVRATSRSRLMTLEREEFLLALTDDAQGMAVAATVVDQRIAANERIAPKKPPPAGEAGSEPEN
ncbi:MAG: MFS transporter [Actinomycetota bacterium]|nr:MFS transporter [Actinomycetota bacterium]